MIKLSWPYIGDPELEMGSMSATGDSDRDIQMDAEPGYSTMVAQISTSPDASGVEPPGYAGGIFFPLDDTYSDIEDDEYQSMCDMSEKFVNLLKKDSTILGIGPQTAGSASTLLKLGHNLISLSKNASSKININNFHQEYGSPMFHTFRNKFDSFYMTNAPQDSCSFEIALENIKSHLRPVSSGFVLIKSSSDLSAIFERHGFLVEDKHIGKFGKYIISQNILDKTAIVRCYNKDLMGEASIIFRCDIAESHKEKIDGLQVYSNLREESGLLFPYDKPTDVSYHMGSVGYPIDIIFIDDDSKIKKICKNIQPGSLGIYSCAGVKNVLEISGGLSDVLGIKESSIVCVERGSGIGSDLKKLSGIADGIGVNNVIFKRSKVLNSGFYNIFENNIYVVNNNDKSVKTMIKKASLNITHNKNIAAFDIDNLIISEDANLRLYRHMAPDNKKEIYRGLYNETFSINKESFIDISLAKVASDGFYKNINSKYSIIPSYFMSLAKFNNRDRSIVLRKIHDISKDPSKKIVFASRRNIDKNILESILQKEIEMATGDIVSIGSDLVRIPESFGTEDLFDALSEKYSGRVVELYNKAFIKSAGIPVPDEVKDKARKALRYFERSSDMCNKLVENLNKNIEEYQKIQGQTEVIANSKGQYNQSSKRNSRIAKRMLLNIKNGIQILNEIKDISTTTEIISSIALAAKNSSEGVKEVFELISIIDSEEFVNKCAEKTSNAENLIGDMTNVLSRAKEYINSDILGILVLSE